MPDLSSPYREMLAACMLLTLAGCSGGGETGAAETTAAAAETTAGTEEITAPEASELVSDTFVGTAAGYDREMSVSVTMGIFWTRKPL